MSSPSRSTSKMPGRMTKYPPFSHCIISDTGRTPVTSPEPAMSTRWWVDTGGTASMLATAFGARRNRATSSSSGASVSVSA